MDAEAHIAQYVTVLAHLLLWAVQRACRRFASGNVTKAECPDWKRAYGPHFSVHRTLLGLWFAIGALVASAPGVQAEEGQQRYTSRTTPWRTCTIDPWNFDSSGVPQCRAQEGHCSPRRTPQGLFR